MMLEMLSWSIGVGSRDAAFKQVIKTINLIQSSLDPREADPEFSGLEIPLQGVIFKKHKMDVLPTKPAKGQNSPEDKSDIKSLITRMMDFRLRLTWVDRDRNELETILAQLSDLVTHLEAFVPECHLSSGVLAASILAKLSNEEQLEALAHSNDKIDRALASSAKAKVILDDSPADQAGNASRITSQSLTLAKDSLRFGILRMKGSMSHSVRMEWNFLNDGGGSEEYVKRNKFLAYLLERVSRPEYYHPDAHEGFTKPRDLVSERKKAMLVNRSASRGFVDIGWRMGKHYQSAARALLLGDLPAQSGDEVFAQQYVEKVVYPLSKRTA
ncbi:hypothetical protein ACHAQJ_010324 [Trichoderma viride]